MDSPFSHPGPLIVALVALAALYVIFPTVLQAFLRYRRPRILTCPETGGPVAIHLDAARAAATSAYDEHPHLQVRQCSLWPERQGCGQACLKIRGMQ